jgi:RecB family endonuclease NucS
VIRHSTTGYVFNIKSGVISWSLKRQLVIVLSSCEVEYIGETQAIKEAIWLRNLLAELLKSKEEPTVTIIYRDNQGAIALAKNP